MRRRRKRGADGTAGFQTGEEHVLSRLKKLLLSAATVMVLAAGVAVTPASATVPTWGRNAEQANVPYLAWRGEHVRLGYCLPSLVVADLAVANTDTATWAVEDWSGDPGNGSVPVPYELFGSAHTSGNCFYADFTSQKAGVAFIKLELTTPAGVPVLDHQFMAIWMDLNAPVVSIVGGSTPTTASVDPADFCQLPRLFSPGIESPELIALSGFRNCDPKTDPTHRVNVTVTGNVPLLADFSEWGLGDHITLPADWPKLAGVAAQCTAGSSVDNNGVSNSNLCHTLAEAVTNWDIHDDSVTHDTPTTAIDQVMTGGVQCPIASETMPAGSTDEVTNCTGGGASGPFSTVFGTPTTALAWGPFDPLFAADTMLSDGKVDAGDAPMPAARIDMTIAENGGVSKTDISGVGYLYPSNKLDVYSLNGTGGTDPKPIPFNLYAPYYSQYIPATTRPPAGTVQPTGITGTTATGYNGFLNNGGLGGLYDNWEFAWENSFHPNTASKCLQQQTYLPFRQIYRPLPYGLSSVSVYTDEGGEANVNFVPGLGMYFDNLTSANKNLNGGCDLEGIDPLGTATINTTAVYPYQPVTDPNPTGDPVTFTVDNLFKKSLTVYSKGLDENGITSNSLAKIVLAHAQDIDGSPLALEEVCWMADSNAEGFRSFSGTLPDPSDPTKSITITPAHAALVIKDPLGEDRLCTLTDLNGNSAIEVFNSNNTTVNVIAEFVNEGILRDTKANFALTSGVTGSSIAADGPPTSIPPTSGQIKLVGAVGASGPVVVTSKVTAYKTIKSKTIKAKKLVHKIRFARVVTPFHGKAKLQVRVNGKPGMVKLRIMIRKGSKNHYFVRFVPANHKINVGNLVIPKKTTKVTVSLLSI
jgi:hypothetical protein